MMSNKSGYVPAFSRAAYCFRQEIGTTMNRAEAARPYKMGAEAGDEVALCGYALCLLYGRGVRRKEKGAVVLVKLAECAGSVSALNVLGTCYAKELDVEKCLETAFEDPQKNIHGHVDFLICLEAFRRSNLERKFQRPIHCLLTPLMLKKKNHHLSVIQSYIRRCRNTAYRNNTMARRSDEAQILVLP